ncbi:MAG: alpha/beta hydrolase [Akkermansiaceae bacterium]|jgi:acetyl esterase/lipase
MKAVLILSALLIPAIFAAEPLPLWEGKAPGALGETPKDIPTLTPFLPEKPAAARAAMVICPGGGYGGLADHEGSHYAKFLNEHGIAAFVLKYRLGSSGYRHPIMLNDAARAVRMVRARATEWNIDPTKVGIMGSSAGGHLTSTLLTHFDARNAEAADPIDRQSSRPDLGVLCYAVITMGEFTHKGSKKNLLGDNPSEELVTLLSSELQVKADTPPCFIWHTWDDGVVPVENSMLFASALRKKKVPFDFHVYQKGAHGMGLGTKGDPEKSHPWTRDLVFWLKAQGWTP